MKSFSLLLVFALFGVAFSATTTSDVIFQVFSDSSCTVASTLVSYIPNYAKNGACLYSDAFKSYFTQSTNLTTGIITFGLLCSSSDCSSCPVTGNTTNGVCTPVQVLTNTLYLLGFTTISDTVAASVYSEGPTTYATSTSYGFISKCYNTNTSVVNLNLGVCTQYPNSNVYSVTTAVTGSSTYSYAVVRNCTDAACSNCQNGGYYDPSSTCIKTETTKGSATVNFGAMPVPNLAPTSAPTQGPTSAPTTASQATTAPSSTTSGTAALVVSSMVAAVAALLAL